MTHVIHKQLGYYERGGCHADREYGKESHRDE